MQRGSGRTWESAKITRVRGASLGSQSAMLALPPAIADHSSAGAWGGQQLCVWLSPHLCGLVVERIEPAGAGVVIEARSRAPGAACPACGAWSSRVHSGYTRTVADGPAGSGPVVIRLAVRRLFCPDPAWMVVTVAVQVAGLTGRHLPAERAAAGVTGADGAGAGGPGRGPAGRRAGYRGAPDHAAGPGRRLARTSGQRRAGGD